MDLRHQIAFLRSSLPLIVIGTLVGALAAFLVSSVLPPTYEAETTLLVGQASNPGTTADYNQLLISQRLSQTYAQLVTLPEIASGVIKKLNLSTTPQELLKHVRAAAALDSTLLTVTADAGTADDAAKIANAFVAQLLASPFAQQGTSEVQTLVQQDLLAVRAQTQQIQDQIDALVAKTDRTDAEDQQLASLQTQMIGLRSTLATLLSLSTGSNANVLTVVDPATPPPSASSPKIPLNTALGAMLGLLAAVGIAYTMRRLDDTIKTPDDVESLTGLPLLGMIVRMPGDKGKALQYRLATLLYPRSPAAEGFRHVRTNVDFASGEAPLRSLLVASAVPGEGKTVTASNLAVAYAQAGRTTCLVDADLRRPTIHELFGLPNDHGLSTLMAGQEATYESVTHATDVTGLRVLTSGPLPPNPAELLASPRMRAILAGILERVDLVIIDSPPLQAVTDAAVLSSLVDGTILVVAAGRTRRGSLVRGRDSLQRVGANVLGALLNGVSEGMDSGAAFAYFGYYGTAAPTTALEVDPSSVFSPPLGPSSSQGHAAGNGRTPRSGSASRSSSSSSQRSRSTSAPTTVPTDDASVNGSEGNGRPPDDSGPPPTSPPTSGTRTTGRKPRSA
jgi:polysaccharide biosynthesis transport protein